ncbi:MAG: hypothetical protein AAF703_02955 [Cyanobacteria bacterium P01_D01_bin.105]
MTGRQIAIAHQVEIADDIGATLHIEPNDTPRAGEGVLAWFALAKRGGQTVPLSDCDCQIQLYDQSSYDQSGSDSPIASLMPHPVDSEGYQGIPGAEVTFPEVGAYTLVISGRPKHEASFKPFELAFDVTVAAGAKAGQQDSELVSETGNQETGNQDSGNQNKREPDSEAPSEEVSDATPTLEGPTRQTVMLVGIGIVGAGLIGAIALARKQK